MLSTRYQDPATGTRYLLTFTRTPDGWTQGVVRTPTGGLGIETRPSLGLAFLAAVSNGRRLGLFDSIAQA